MVVKIRVSFSLAPLLLFQYCQLACTTSIGGPNNLPGNLTLPNVTYSGYLDVSREAGSAIFYSYYESQHKVSSNTPVILWLQGGPGCAGHFGNFYELGPALVNETLQLEENPGAWNRKAGLLVVDQPVGTGFSRSGSGRIPTDEDMVALDMYSALQNFFVLHSDLQSRPFVITGESYAGKYVPKIGHFILQMESQLGEWQRGAPLTQNRLLPKLTASLGAPKFKLVALAIGNGLTDPVRQVQTHADTAFFQGLIDEQQRMTALAMQLSIGQAIALEDWARASRERENLLGYLKEAIGAGTMLDTRRTFDYDSQHLVYQYLNQQEVKESLGADKDIEFVSCSEVVGKALGPDVMRSVKYVIPDLLAAMPLLLYQGAFDAQDGPATSEAWIHSLDWPGRLAFAHSQRHIWRAKPDGTIPGPDFLSSSTQRLEKGKKLGPVLGWWREAGTLTHVVLKNAGHMVPRDDPVTAQRMLESWLERSLSAGSAGISLRDGAGSTS